MKYLLIPLLFMFGCSRYSDFKTADPSSFKYSVGDKVITSEGLYKNCDGFVYSYEDWADKYGNHVNIRFYCPNLGYLKDLVTVKEDSLSKV